MTLKNLVESVHHTALNVQDFGRMRAFLVDFIGFEVESELAERNEPELEHVTGQKGARFQWAILRMGTHRIELFQYFTPTGQPVPPAQCDVGFTHLAFTVGDVHQTHARCLAAGYEPLSTPQVMRGGVSQVFYLRGPEDVIVEFMEFAKTGNT